MIATVIPFPPKKPFVFIDPVVDNGGEWGVFLQRPSERPLQVTTRFAYPAAEIAAREIAKQRGADFLDDTTPEPKGAA